MTIKRVRIVAPDERRLKKKAERVAKKMAKRQLKQAARIFEKYIENIEDVRFDIRVD